LNWFPIYFWLEVPFKRLADRQKGRANNQTHFKEGKSNNNTRASLSSSFLPKGEKNNKKRQGKLERRLKINPTC